MQELPQPAYLRFHVWGFSVASAVAAGVLCLLTLPVHMWKHEHYAGYGMLHGGGSAYPGAGPMIMHHAGLGLWPLWALILVVLWAGIGGAIFAAVYNAMQRPRS